MTTIKKIQNQQTPIMCLTAHSYPIAKIIDKYCDIILVGDSLAMTVYGMENTKEVTIEMMINHAKAVKKAAKNALIVVDMPFGSYESSPKQALKNATRIINETGCDAVKVETNENIIKTIEFLTKNNINVMGHIGLLPQNVSTIDGYKYQGKDQDSADKITDIAIQTQKAGAFAIVIEAVPAKLADLITKKVNIPTIGIGASVNCDGQILVSEDVFGLNQEFKPRFVQRYGNLVEEIEFAVRKFCIEVKEKKFPAKRHMI